MYEYFFDQNRAPDFSKKDKFVIAFFTLISFFTCFVINIYQPHVPFYFSLLIISLLLGLIFMLASHKILINRIIKFGFFAFIVGILVEYFSSKLGLWSFPKGDFIYSFSYFGFRMPIEEILGWLIFPMWIATVHEIFADNQK
jgi:hypothetical protein